MGEVVETNERIGDQREGTFQAEESSYQKHRSKEQHGVCVCGPTNTFILLMHKMFIAGSERQDCVSRQRPDCRGSCVLS